jgi:hypothetical protein
MSRENQEDCGFLKLPRRRGKMISNIINLEVNAAVTIELTDFPATVPLAVQDKLQSVIDVSMTRNAALRATSAEMREAQTALHLDRERLREMERLEKSDPAALARAQAKAKRSGEVLAKLTAQLEELSSSWKPAHVLAQNLEHYVRANAGNGFAMFQGGVPRLQAGENARDGLERAARRTRALKADRREVLAAPLPSSLAKRFAWHEMLARIEAAKPDVTPAIDRGEPIIFPTRRLEQYGGQQDLFATDPVGLMAWLFPAEVRAAIDREIDAAAEDEIALSPEQRSERLAEIDGDILASEREEAAYAELAGLLPRPDIDPRAALQLADIMPAPKGDA